MRLLTAGSLVRAQQGEPNKKTDAKRRLFFCLSRLGGIGASNCAAAASRLLTGSGTAAADGRGRRCLSRKKQGVRAVAASGTTMFLTGAGRGRLCFAKTLSSRAGGAKEQDTPKGVSCSFILSDNYRTMSRTYRPRRSEF